MPFVTRTVVPPIYSNQLLLAGLTHFAAPGLLEHDREGTTAETAEVAEILSDEVSAPSPVKIFAHRTP
jgi:hypothetical protein